MVIICVFSRENCSASVSKQNEVVSSDVPKEKIITESIINCSSVKMGQERYFMDGHVGRKYDVPVVGSVSTNILMLESINNVSPYDILSILTIY